MMSENACIAQGGLIPVQEVKRQCSPQVDIRITPAGQPLQGPVGETEKGKRPFLRHYRRPGTRQTSTVLRRTTVARYLPACHYPVSGLRNAVAFHAPILHT